MRVLQTYEATQIPRVGLEDSQSVLIENFLAQMGTWNHAQLHCVSDHRLSFEYRIVAMSPDAANQGEGRTKLLLSVWQLQDEDTPTDRYLDGFRRLLPKEYAWKVTDAPVDASPTTGWHIARVVRRVDFAMLPSPSALAPTSGLVDEIFPGAAAAGKPAGGGFRRLPDSRIEGRGDVIKDLESYEVCLPCLGTLGEHTAQYRRLFQELDSVSSVVISIAVHPVDRHVIERDRFVAGGWNQFLHPFAGMLASAGVADRAALLNSYDRYWLPRGHLSQLTIRVATRDPQLSVGVANHVCARLGGAKGFVVVPPSAKTCGSTLEKVLDPTIDLPDLNDQTWWKDRSTLWRRRLEEERIELMHGADSPAAKAELEFLVGFPHLFSVDETQRIMALPLSDERGLPGIATQLVPPFGTVSNQYDPVVLQDDKGNCALSKPPQGRMRLGMSQRLPVVGSSNSWDQPGVQHWHSIALNDLCKHAMIVGSTGSGKTRTASFLIRELARKHRGEKGIPFLVIEPVKTEYYDTLKDFVPNLNRVNYEGMDGRRSKYFFPFDPMRLIDGVTVARHASYLKSCFEAAFPMEPSMALILESGIREYYTSSTSQGGCGLRLFSNGSKRCMPGGSEYELRGATFPTIFPSLRTFAQFFCLREEDTFVHRACPHFGSGQGADWANQVVQMFKRRFDNLLNGVLGEASRQADLLVAKGYKELLSERLVHQPTVLELDGIPDPEQKSLAIAFLMTFLFELRQAQDLAERREQKPHDGSLRHVVIIEEAHRLLANFASNRGTNAGVDSREKAVSLFVDMLAEVRAYGQGIMIVEQIPTKITPAAVKNTNLKVMLRLTSRDDREYLGTAMNMSDEQLRFVTGLRAKPGQGVQYVVFEEGIDQPALLSLPIPPHRDPRFDDQFFVDDGSPIPNFVIRKS